MIGGWSVQVTHLRFATLGQIFQLFIEPRFNLQSLLNQIHLLLTILGGQIFLLPSVLFLFVVVVVDWVALVWVVCVLVAGSPRPIEVDVHCGLAAVGARRQAALVSCELLAAAAGIGRRQLRLLLKLVRLAGCRLPRRMNWLQANPVLELGLPQLVDIVVAAIGPACVVLVWLVEMVLLVGRAVVVGGLLNSFRWHDSVGSRVGLVVCSRPKPIVYISLLAAGVGLYRLLMLVAVAVVGCRRTG